MRRVCSSEVNESGASGAGAETLESRCTSGANEGLSKPRSIEEANGSTEQL